MDSGRTSPTRRTTAWALALAPVVTACVGTWAAAPPEGGAAARVRSGVTAGPDGTQRIAGSSRASAREALADAMRRAEAFAREQARVLEPLRFEPGQGQDAFGQPQYTCTLVFRLREPAGADGMAADDHTYAAFEHRMRLLVESGVLTVEEYARLMESYPTRR